MEMSRKPNALTLLVGMAADMLTRNVTQRRIRANSDNGQPRHKPNGAFGKCKGPFDRSPALKPAQMRAMAAKG